MNVIVRILAVVGVLAILALFFFLIAGLMLFSGGGGSVPAKTILELDLERGLIEYVPQDPVAEVLLGDRATVRDVVEILEKAGRDERVVAVVARVGAAPLGLGVVQELRDAILAFRDQGKPAVAWSETFGEFSQGNGAYYLATAFDEIYLQPSGDVNLLGLLYEIQFFRGALDKLDVEPRMGQRHEYKNAMNVYTDKELSPAFRESLTAVAESQFGQIVRGVAAARGLSEEEVRSLVDGGPFLAAEAQDAGLVDALVYRDEVYERVREKVGKEAELLYGGAYLDRAGRPHDSGTRVALIYGVGGVMRGESEYDPLGGSFVMGADSVSAAFRAAVDDEEVKAILFRVSSPGGSYVASDTIWRETVRARNAGKPVIVSMGNVAGSGGYFVSMHADKIVAQPGTITASIGVLGGKLLTEGLWDKIGLSWDEVQTSENATLYSMLHDYSPAEWERFEALLDRIYEDFTSKVADGRGLPLERVLEIARGRIWTGEDGLELGLVDAVGGFGTALQLTREALELPEDAELHLVPYPGKKSLWQMLTEDGPSSSREEGQAAVLLARRTLEAVRPLVRVADRMGLRQQPGELSMPVELPAQP
jgi:protease-4